MRIHPIRQSPPRSTSATAYRGLTYYRSDLDALDGSAKLAGVKSVSQVCTEKGILLMDDGDPNPDFVVQYGNARRPEEAREWLNGPSDAEGRSRKSNS